MPTRFPVPITASAGLRVGREAHRIEPEVGPEVRDTAREGARGKPEPSPWIRDRLVGEIDHHVHVHFDQRVVQVVPEGNAVVGNAAAELLGSAEQHGADDFVLQRRKRLDDHVGIVLSVDERESSHGRRVSSVSMRAVYFSYSSVSVENWMIRSCPWNGYLRQTSTCLPSISTTL